MIVPATIATSVKEELEIDREFRSQTRGQDALPTLPERCRYWTRWWECLDSAPDDGDQGIRIESDSKQSNDLQLYRTFRVVSDPFR